MIFLDANVFLRFFVQPGTDEDRRMTQQSRQLFTGALEGRYMLTTSDVIVAEVAFILTSRRHYGVERIEAANKIKSVLLLDGFRFSETATCLRALDLWTTMARLSFPDALAAAYGERYRHQLATFDSRLAALPSVEPFQFPDVEV